MAFRIQCLGCYEEIVAQEADRGGSIPCGVCGTAVAVPAQIEAAPRRRARMSERSGRPPPRKTNRPLLRALLFLGIALPCLLACCGGLGYVFRQRIADTVSGRGGPSDDPDIPRDWRRVKGDGFIMYAPAAERAPHEHTISVGEQRRLCREYRHVYFPGHGIVTVTLVHSTLGDSLLKRSSHAELLEGMFVFSREARELGDRSVGGRDGKEYRKDTIVGREYYWVGKVGDRAYGLGFEWFGGAMDDPRVQRLREAWLRSVSISYPANASSDSDPPFPDPWAGRHTRDTQPGR